MFVRKNDSITVFMKIYIYIFIMKIIFSGKLLYVES